MSSADRPSWTDGLRTRHLFFTGKGGVGKTSLACACAVSLANRGRRVLIVSTDPASNLDEVFQTKLGSAPTPVPGAPNVWAANLDPVEAARRYRERAVEPYRDILPPAALRSIEEQFSGACTVEIAAFDEFARLLGDASATAEFAHVVFDTAPTGHTLRLLSLPAAWSGFIAGSETGVSCLGPLSALARQEALYGSTLAVLKDAAATSIILVARPDVASLREAERARGELEALEVRSLRLVVNGVFAASSDPDPVARALAARGRKALAQRPAGLAALPTEEVPLLPGAVVGLPAIRRLLEPDEAPLAGAGPPSDLPSTESLAELVAALAAGGPGVVMTMGKGGVGKTTLAAAIAVALAEQGRPVLLTTTDPAAHVRDAVRRPLPNLEVQRIDPQAEVAAYRSEVIATAGAKLDAAGLALLEEDLRSPCTEEIAVFRGFARAVEQGQDRWVVLDTAPTGHTVLLLDAAEAFHREVARTRSAMPESVRQLLPRLRDPAFTRVLIVTLPEPTPVHEAAHLQHDLRRAGIEPYAWIINQSLLLAGTRHPLLRHQAAAEVALFREVALELSRARTVAMPWSGEENLLTLARAL